MARSIRKPVVALLPVMAGVFAVPAHAWDPIQDALTTTAKFNMNFRLRYEGVDDASRVLEDAEALTLRSRLTYESGSYEKFAVGLEMDDVTNPMSKEEYNDGVNGQTRYSTITDPEGTEVNQVWISYAGVPDTQAKLGRQRIVLDNERFVGAVAFRQNEQTYDAFSVSNKSLSKTTLYYANINNVNRIFGEDNKLQGDHETDTHLFNAKYEGIPGLTLTGYAYLMDYVDSNKATWLFSNDTYGMRMAGKRGFGDETLKYTLEYATQTEAYDNPIDYSADYYLGEIAYGNATISGTLGYEVLGTDDGATVNATGATTSKGFQTPLATLHKFQGWTDQFLGGGSGNIAVGIKDMYLGLEGQAYGLNWSVNYHEYDADKDTAAVDHLGSEWGASLEKKWGNYTLGVKYSDYSADDSEALAILDKDKIWVTAQAAF